MDFHKYEDSCQKQEGLIFQFPLLLIPFLQWQLKIKQILSIYSAKKFKVGLKNMPKYIK